MPRLFLRHFCVSGRCVCSSRFCADTLGGTHRWQSGPVLRALLLALVHEPSGKLVVDAEHLTIPAILEPAPNRQLAPLVLPPAQSPCAGEASCLSSDTSAPTQPYHQLAHQRHLAEAVFDVEVLRCKYLRGQSSNLRVCPPLGHPTTTSAIKDVVK